MIIQSSLQAYENDRVFYFASHRPTKQFSIHRALTRSKVYTHAGSLKWWLPRGLKGVGGNALRRGVTMKHMSGKGGYSR